MNSNQKITTSQINTSHKTTASVNNSSGEKPMARLWLITGIAALAIAGLYSLTLVVGRAPIFSENANIQRIFKDALVVHVDLSVLLWFLAVACIFWSRCVIRRRSFIPYVEEAALICFVLAVVLMMMSPFDPSAVALMSNYIPVIHSPIFFMALGVLLSGVMLMAGRQLLCCDLKSAESGAALIIIIAIICFLLSYQAMPEVIEGEQYYDLLFWSGGHVLQLAYGQFAMLAWIMLSEKLASLSNCQLVSLNRIARLLFAVNLLLAAISPLAYSLYDVESAEFRNFFTRGIMTIGGVMPGIVALMALYYCWKFRNERKGEQRALWSALLFSAALFLYGGALGLMISGQNVTIPAHYHGSIVGITIAFIGLIYLLLPHVGYRQVAGLKLAYWQPIIVGTGQLLHISGLAYSGGYGVLRKTSGGVAEMAINLKIALGIMGIGGLLAIIGGLIFVIITLRAIKAN